MCADRGKIGGESKKSKPGNSRKIIFCGTPMVIAIVAILFYKLILYEGPEGRYTHSFYISKMLAVLTVPISKLPISNRYVVIKYVIFDLMYP